MRKLFKGGNYSRAETIRGNTVSGFKGYRFSLLAAMVAVCKEIESFQKNLKSQEILDKWESWIIWKLDRAELGLAQKARILVDIKANLYRKK